MPRTVLLLTVLLTAVVSSQALGNDFWHRVKLDFLRMNSWPDPFVQADRELVVAPLVAMTNSGWQMQNTLSHHFFDGETQRLTRAGQLKLHWILTQAPSHRRTVFVVRATDSTAMELRVASVREQTYRMLPESTTPEVLVTDTIPPGGAGDYFDAVDRQLKASVPVPRLPPRVGSADFGS